MRNMQESRNIGKGTRKEISQGLVGLGFGSVCKIKNKKYRQWKCKKMK